MRTLTAVLLLLLTCFSTAPAQNAATAEKIDPAEVRQKIAALALRDDTVPYDEQPVNWLHKRRQEVLPQLIAALGDKNPTIVEQCLNILWNILPSKELTDALIAKAGDENLPVRQKALQLMEKSAADPRVVKLLDEASTQAERFPDPLVRARWAWLAGRKDRAVEILKPAVAKLDEGGNTREAILLLGEIGEPGSIALLEPVAAGNKWTLAVAAYLSLAKIDPKGHSLTKDQAAFLEEAWRVFKESTKDYQERIVKLATLNAKEVRPFVLQMLRDEDRMPAIGALAILTAWNDKEALPEIRTLLSRSGRSSIPYSEAVAAYLVIDGGRQSQADVLDLLKKGEDIDNENILSGIVVAAIPTDRKVAMLRTARGKVQDPAYVLPRALNYEIYYGRDIRDLLVPLMDNETDLEALGGYCKLAAEDKQKRFAPQVRRALKLLSSEPAFYGGPGEGPHVDYRIQAAGQLILESAAACDLKDLAADVRNLMGSRDETIRVAAQAAGAKLGVAGAMNDLYAQLGNENVYVRQCAAKALVDVRPADETERAAREAAALSHLGKPSEDYAMRVLTTCGGEKAVKALEPILDDADAQRAVYAAWVLAQLPDKPAAAKGLRRVAIFAMFHHQMYQRGSGIDFRIAPGLYFHQTTRLLNPNADFYSSGKEPLRIPKDLLQSFSLEDAETEFAVRCYRFSQTPRREYIGGIDFLYAMRWIASDGRHVIDKSYLPLLRAIATEDSGLKRLMVKGQVVPHFEHRQRAAQAIAAITGQKATYIGLAGETLDSQAFPEPYKDMDELLARFAVNRMEKNRPPANPQTDEQWDQVGAWRAIADHLSDLFGEQVLAAIREEAKSRGIDLKGK